MTPKCAPHQKQMVDAIVVGLGIMGAATTLQLARQGFKVLAVDQAVPGGPQGASFGSSRIIRTAYAEGPDYVPMVQEAWRLWKELELEAGQPILVQTGGVSVGPPNAPIVTGALRSAERHGLAVRVMSSKEMENEFPQFVVKKGEVGIYETSAGVIRADVAISECLKLAQSAGAAIVTSQRVALVRGTTPLAVRVAGQIVTCSHLVLTCGAWLGSVMPSLSRALRPVRRIYGVVRALDAVSYSEDWAPVLSGSDASGSRVWYGLPSIDGATVKIGIHSWPAADEVVDPDVGPRPSDATDSAALERIVADSFRHTARQPSSVVSCTYTQTPDQAFLVGPLPAEPRIVVIGGGSGHDFKFAPLLARSVVRHLSGQEHSFGRLNLSPSRFAG